MAPEVVFTWDMGQLEQVTEVPHTVSHCLHYTSAITACVAAIAVLKPVTFWGFQLDGWRYGTAWTGDTDSTRGLHYTTSFITASVAAGDVVNADRFFFLLSFHLFHLFLYFSIFLSHRFLSFFLPPSFLFLLLFSSQSLLLTIFLFPSTPLHFLLPKLRYDKIHTTMPLYTRLVMVWVGYIGHSS